MIQYILKRLGFAAVTLLVLALITFVMMHLLPGDPFLGDKVVNPTVKAALNAKYGLDKPLAEQFFIYIKNVLQGDFGVSIKSNRPVARIIAEAFPYSAELGLRALFIAVILGLSLGVISAVKRGTALDSVSMIIAVIGISVPSFIIGALLQYVFAIQFRKWFGISFFPVMGWKSEAAKILPSISLSLGVLASLARIMRTSMLDVLHQDYMKTAKAKGLSQPTTIRRHALRNAVLPVITYLGPQVALLLTGTFVVEYIFNIPGLGKFFVQSIREYDYPVISGMTLFYGSFLVICVLIVDIIYGFVDPRIKIVKRKEVTQS